VGPRGCVVGQLVERQLWSRGERMARLVTSIDLPPGRFANSCPTRLREIVRFTLTLSALEFIHRRSLLPLSVVDLVPNAKGAKTKARDRHRAVAEQTHKDAERQNDPGDIPQNDPIGH
jgi:hypothetical protein